MSDDKDAWQSTFERIRQLKEYDRALVVCGASRHQYVAAASASMDDVVASEVAIGTTFPSELKFIYTSVFNGGVGQITE